MRWIPRPRFRLLTLLIVVTALCLWLGVVTHGVKQRKDAVERLEKLGAAVFFDYQRNAQGHFDQKLPPPVAGWARRFFGEDYFKKAICLRIWDVRLTDDDLHAIAVLHDLETLEFYRCDFSQVDCPPLAELRELKELLLDQCDLGPTSLAPVSRLTNLAKLKLTDMDVDDAKFPPLAQLASLESLVLEKVPVTGRTFGDLSRLSKLKTLIVSDVPLDDEAMKAIGSLPAPQSLKLLNTSITDAGLACLATRTSITKLQIDRAAITDEGLRKLAGLASLADLAVIQTRIEGKPAALESLHQLHKLRFLALHMAGDDTTGKAVRQLRKALPNCQVKCYDTAHGGER